MIGTQTVGACVLLAAVGCSPTAPYVWVDEFSPQRSHEPPAYHVRPGDTLHVVVWKQEDLSGDKAVRTDGMITLVLVGDIHVAGLTLAQAAEMMTRRLDGVIVDPSVTVSLVSAAPQTVSVVGEVDQPGFYDISGQKTVLQLVAEAGGLTEFAGDDIFVLRAGTPTTRIRISYDKLSRGLGQAIHFRLQSNDVIVVD